MRGLNRAVPSYRKHKSSGQAVVSIGGVDHYLGPHGSDTSIAEYDRLIAEYLASGRRLVARESTTVNVLAAAFLHHCQSYYVKDGKPTTEVGEFRRMIKTLSSLYGDQPVEAFGPIALKACRQQWIDSGVTRQTVNKRQGRAVRMFKWGVEQEIVDAAVWQALTSVQPLHVGRQSMPEMKEVPPVELDRVNAVLPFLSPVVANMIRLQLLTGMRPGEVCRLRPADLDRSGDVWEFTVKGHKTVHHGRERTVYIGKEAQAVLTPYLLRSAESCCFSAAESKAWYLAERTAKRTTPESSGNGAGRRHGTQPRAGKSRRPSDRFTSSSYGKAIAAACRRAWPVPKELKDDPAAVKEWHAQNRWAPNQLRHTRGTEIRKRYGLDVAQVILGHAKADVTQVYAEADRQKAIAAMREIG